MKYHKILRKGELRMLNKIKMSGIVVLAIGVGLLIFTFINAFLFLHAELGLIASQDFVGAFGEALAPLIATCIRVMYLSVMGWIGSILTIRGITVIRHVSPPQTSQKLKPKAKAITQKQAKKAPERDIKSQEKPRTAEKNQEEVQHSEETIVLPPPPPPMPRQ
jgi:hypothetical protein